MLKSIYHEPGIGLDANAIKYLAFFRVISYLKIVRVAKVIEATKKLNGTVRKKIIKKSRKLAELLEKRRGSSALKGRRNKSAHENELQFAVKYFNDLDKYKGEIKMTEVKNSSNVLISGSQSNNKESSPLHMKPNRISREQTGTLKREGNKFLSALNFLQKKGGKRNSNMNYSENDKGKLNLNPFSLLLRRRSIFPANTKTNAAVDPKDPLGINLFHELNKNSNLLKKNPKGSTITDRLNLLRFQRAKSILPSIPSIQNPSERSGRGSRFSQANKSESSEGKSGIIKLKPLQPEILDHKQATTQLHSNLLSSKVNFLLKQKSVLDEPHKQEFRQNNIEESTAMNYKANDSHKLINTAKQNSELSDFYNIVDNKIAEKLKGFNAAGLKRESYLISSNIPEVIAEDESEHNKTQKMEGNKRRFVIKAVKLQSGKNLVYRKMSNFQALSKEISRSVCTTPQKTVTIVYSLLKLRTDECKLLNSQQSNLVYRKAEKCKLLDFNDNSISISKSRVSPYLSESDNASSSSSSVSSKKIDQNINTVNNQSNSKPFDFNELKQLNGGSAKSNWFIKKDTLKDEPVISTVNLKKVINPSEENIYEISPDKKSLSKLSKTPEDSIEENENIDKLNTETAILNRSSNREMLDDGKDKIFVLDGFGTKDYKDNEANHGNERGDDNNLDLEEIDYHNVEDLDDDEVEDERKSKKYEKLNIETLLNRSIILKLVTLIMGIIILLQMTNPNYIQDLSSTEDTDKIDYCIAIFIMSITKIMNYTQNSKSKSQKSMSIDYQMQSYLDSLNQTITICFGYLKVIPEDFDAETWNGRLLSTSTNEDIAISMNDNELDSDHLLFDFLLVNMTMCEECKYIQSYFEDYISFPNVVSSEKYTNNHGMTLNIDYYYKSYSINGSESYIECLVDLHYVSFLDKLMNLLRSLFVTIVLILVSHMLNKDIKEKVVVMVIKLIKKFRHFFHNSSQDYFSLLMSEEKNEDEMMLYRKLGIFSYYFDLSCGKRILGLVSQSENNNFKSQYNFEKEGVRFQGTLMMVKFKTSSSKVNLFSFIKEINRIYTIIHSLAYSFGGEIINENKIIWKNKEELFDIDCLNYCRKISKINYNFNFKVNTSTVNKLLNPKRITKGSEENKEFQDRLDTNLALLCSAEIACTLSQKFSHSLQVLSEGGIKLQIFLIKDDLLYGFIGNKEITVNQTIYSRKAKLTLDTMVCLYNHK